MVRFRLWLATAFALSAIGATLLRAQVSEEEKQKRDAFLKTRQVARPEASPSPKGSPSPSAKAKSPKPNPKKSPSPTPKSSPEKSPSARAKSKASPDMPTGKKSTSPSAKPKPTETPEATEDSPTPKKSPNPKAKAKSAKKKKVGKKEPTQKKKTAKAKAKKKETPETDETPAAKKVRSRKPAETPMELPAAAAPRAIAVPSTSAPPVPTATIASDAFVEEAAEMTIEKSGYQKRRGFWSRLFGGSADRRRGGYRYLTGSVRAEIDRAPAERRDPRWQRIVVHNSGTRQGNARVFDYYHRRVRRMRNGLAYHFVIGNGTSTGNGQIEVGDRWRGQINGGHVHSDHLNNIALGICLVGDFNRDQPTRAQLESCEELIRYLRQRCGKTGNHFAIVQPHREANPPRWGTDCPGDVFPYSWFRRFRE